MIKLIECDRARVSIGLPAYNGEKYIKEALDSILAQTYTDFEVIISDDASTDNTRRICSEYAAKDKRISYHRNKKNLGGSMNFNRVFKLSSGEYFKWIAQDDVLAPNYLSRCIKILDQDQSVVLCHSKTGIIDEYGSLVGTYDLNINVDLKKPHERFGNMISERNPLWNLIHGLMRVSSLRMTPLLGYYIGADRNLLAEISLIGRMYIIPKYLFFRRAHKQTYTERKFHSHKEKLAWWTKVERITFPYCKILIEYFRSIKRVSLDWYERRLCYAQIFRWFIREGFILIIRDVALNIISIFPLGNKIRLFARAWSLKHKLAFKILSSLRID